MSNNVIGCLNFVLIGCAWLLSEYARYSDVPALMCLAAALGGFGFFNLFYMARKGM